MVDTEMTELEKQNKVLPLMHQEGLAKSCLKEILKQLLFSNVTITGHRKLTSEEAAYQNVNQQRAPVYTLIQEGDPVGHDVHLCTLAFKALANTKHTSRNTDTIIPKVNPIPTPIPPSTPNPRLVLLLFII
uniref:Uncharacterized protein n=1 Tax=Pelusios castaneus TaxID=367368 RepID=A0A8C8SPH7_9SAUR